LHWRRVTIELRRPLTQGPSFFSSFFAVTPSPGSGL
jgi:hypothetical protein